MTPLFHTINIMTTCVTGIKSPIVKSHTVKSPTVKSHTVKSLTVMQYTKSVLAPRITVSECHPGQNVPLVRMSPACNLSMQIISTIIQAYCVNVMTHYMIEEGQYGQGTLEPITPGIKDC